MKNRSDLVLKAFLTRCPPEKKKALEHFLPSSTRRVLEEISPFPETVTAEVFANGALLERVHWSWFLPTLKTYPKREQTLFLSAIGGIAAQNLAKTLEINDAEENLSGISRTFLRELLRSSLLGPTERLLPINYLPQSPLSQLLEMSKKDLVRFIDYLSLYDLAHEIRQIVETKILKKIYSLLSDGEREFLKAASRQKETHLLPRIGLDRWDGKEESFRRLLHRRGLARFGAALSSQDPDFVWYVCHQLDIGRGNTLFKLSKTEDGKECLQQAVDLLNRRDHLS
ncbi:MAG: hypothetical protein A3E80_00620 [Chlamydiae bacterium RIFCSPHIGHO2_12_FULL_49_9]|nr:MAG: hypothetical protein A3E80_00620 [Chlamydiae bacterium RIFCSPHIGHO2_12_FULL_49_9]